MYHLAPLKKEELVKLQAEKLNFKEMAIRLDCSLPNVKKYLKKYELISEFVKTIPLNIIELYKLRVEYKWTYRELAELYQVSDSTLRNRCEEFNFPKVVVKKQGNNWSLKPMVNKKKVVNKRKVVNINANKILKELYDIL